MRITPLLLTLLLTALVSGCASAPLHGSSSEWIDRTTGHRVVQLSREPGSESLYFNENAFGPDGQWMAFSTPSGISRVNLKTLQIEQVVGGQRLRIIMVGHKTGSIYFTKREIKDGRTNSVVCVADPDTKTARDLLTLKRGERVSSVNADETLLAGTITDRSDWGTNAEPAEENDDKRSDVERADAYRGKKGTMMEKRIAARYPMELFFYDIATGKKTAVNRCTDWLNHLLFSPTDPHLLMFCHEGPWHRVDRIWTIRTDGSDLKLIHRRTMAMEIAGHEFWSADGDTIWYDLQTPRGEDFWVAGYNVKTGKRTWYHLQRNEWGVHFNVSPDGKLFSSDGGDDRMVAHAPDGKWLYLLHPELIEDRSEGYIDTSKLIQPGVFRSEKLVNMASHDYALEPNARFSPDMKWLIFRGNRTGTNQIYAVEIEKAEKK